MIITLGYHCNITGLNIGIDIKKETGPFEWFESRKLQYITDVINTLTNDPTANVIGLHKNMTEEYIYLLNKKIS